MTSYKFVSKTNEVEASVVQNISANFGSFEVFLNRAENWKRSEFGSFGYHAISANGINIMMDDVNGVPLACVYDTGVMMGEPASDYPLRSLVISLEAFNQTIGCPKKALENFVESFSDDEYTDVIEQNQLSLFTPKRRLHQLIKSDIAIRAATTSVDDVYTLLDTFKKM